MSSANKPKSQQYNPESQKAFDPVKIFVQSSSVALKNRQQINLKTLSDALQRASKLRSEVPMLENPHFQQNFALGKL